MENLKRLSEIETSETLKLALVFMLGFSLSLIFSLTSPLMLAGTNLVDAMTALSSLKTFEIPNAAFFFGAAILGASALLIVMVHREKSAKASRAEKLANMKNSRRSELDSTSNDIIPKQHAVDEVQAELEQQLLDLLCFVSRYLDDGDAYSDSVNEVRAQLDSANSVEQIRTVIETLVDQHEQEQRNVSQLRGSLEEAQARSIAMTERLLKVETEANLDALTSVANRRYFEKFLDEAIAKSHKEETPLCLVMGDLDYFKGINDTFGHQAGDDVIKKFSKLLSDNSRSTDLVARYGGEEFAMVLPRTPIGNAYQISERIRKKLEATMIRESATGKAIGRVTASFGVAEIKEADGSSDLIERADRKLYDAKHNGRNRTEIEGASAQGLNL